MNPAASRNRNMRPAALLILTLALSGCASFSADGGMDAVSQMTKERTGQSLKKTSGDDAAENQTTVRELLAKPLSADDAVHIALLNNRGLQASLADLGIAEADLVQAGRLRNPGVSFGRLNGGGETEIDRGILFDFAGLLTMPMRSKIEGQRFEQAQLQAAVDAVNLVVETRRAYFNAVAAQQSVQLMTRAKDAAEAGAELAQQMRKVGNWNRLDATREQLFYADTASQLARSMQQATVAREQLMRLLGLWQSGETIVLLDRLPDLPSQPDAMNELETQAMTQRLDVQMARRNAAATADALGLTKSTRFINVLDVGYINKSETGKSRSNGYEVSVELPLFDWGTAKTHKAEVLYMQAVHRTADTAIRARSEVRERYAAYRTAYDLARHYRDEVVPLRKQTSDEMLLRYNGMLVSVFDLLADARLQIAAVDASIAAQRDYWLAQTDLQAAINGTGSASSMLSDTSNQSAAAGQTH